MRAFQACRVGIAALLVALMAATGAAQAAGGVKLCLPKHEGGSVVTPKHGKCPKASRLTTLGAEGKQGPAGKEGKAGGDGKAGAEGKQGPAGFTGLSGEELETLQKVLPYMKYVASGVAGSPTVIFSGVNVEVNSGAGKTDAAVNGLGNLVIGYDENEPPAKQTGSNDLVLGEKQTFTSYGGIVDGFENAITGPFASVSGGAGNTASGEFASVSGGGDNTASGEHASVSGGVSNFATGQASSVSGGGDNKAEGELSSLGGGDENTVESIWGWIGGGSKNLIEEKGVKAAILGGQEQTTNTEFAHLP